MPFGTERLVLADSRLPGVEFAYPFREDWQTRACGTGFRDMRSVFWGLVRWRDVFSEARVRRACLFIEEETAGFIDVDPEMIA